jgi:hypothetical protein
MIKICAFKKKGEKGSQGKPQLGDHFEVPMFGGP